MKDKYVVVEIDESEFMAVTKAQEKLSFETRPVGFYRFLVPEMKLIAETICDIEQFNNAYLLQIL